MSKYMYLAKILVAILFNFLNIGITVLHVESSFVLSILPYRAVECIMHTHPEHVNVPDESGSTALHVTAEAGEYEVAKALLENVYTNLIIIVDLNKCIIHEH